MNIFTPLGLASATLLVITSCNKKSGVPIISFESDVQSEEKIVKPKITTKVVKKPSSPSSASAPVISAKSMPIEIPESIPPKVTTSVKDKDGAVDPDAKPATNNTDDK